METYNLNIAIIQSYYIPVYYTKNTIVDLDVYIVVDILADLVIDIATDIAVDLHIYPLWYLLRDQPELTHLYSSLR